MSRLIGLLLLLVAGNAFADYTICWEPPTRNTDESLLTDLDGYNMWAIPVANTYGNPQVFGTFPTEVCVENRGPADCYFEEAGKMCYHKYWPGPEGDWKAKMQAFNDAGTVSADSQEIFFELKDLNGDGNPDVVGGRDPGPIVVPDPDPEPEPDPGPGPIEPPTIVANQLSITRKGYYTITGPDGALLLRPDGNTRRVTNVVEAIEWVTKDGRCCVFTINQPDIEVEWK